MQSTSWSEIMLFISISWKDIWKLSCFALQGSFPQEIAQETQVPSIRASPSHPAPASQTSRRAQRSLATRSKQWAVSTRPAHGPTRKGIGTDDVSRGWRVGNCHGCIQSHSLKVDHWRIPRDFSFKSCFDAFVLTTLATLFSPPSFHPYLQLSLGVLPN